MDNTVAMTGSSTFNPMHNATAPGRATSPRDLLIQASGWMSNQLTNPATLGLICIASYLAYEEQYSLSAGIGISSLLSTLPPSFLSNNLERFVPSPWGSRLVLSVPITLLSYFHCQGNDSLALLGAFSLIGICLNETRAEFAEVRMFFLKLLSQTGLFPKRAKLNNRLSGRHQIRQQLET